MDSRDFPKPSDDEDLSVHTLKTSVMSLGHLIANEVKDFEIRDDLLHRLKHWEATALLAVKNHAE